MASDPNNSSLKNFEDRLDRLRRFTLNSAVVVATVLVLCITVSEVFSGSYIIEPLNVAKSFSDKIPDSDGIAAELRDEIGAAWFRAFSETAVKPVVRQSDEPDLKVSGTDLPIRYIAGLIRDIFQFPIVHVSGQVLPPPLHGDRAAEEQATFIRVTLTTSSRASGPYFDEVGGYPAVLRSAAVETLAQIDPFAAAWALTQGDARDREHALTLARTALNDTRSHEWPIWIYHYLGFRSSVPRGELAVGSALFSLGENEAARLHFEAANAEFALREGRGDSWYAADDGIATTFIREKRFDDARTAAGRALRERPGYDSAEYHLAEITDNEARSFYRNEKSASLTFCEAEQLVMKAKAGYTELLNKHPQFAIAYTQLGTLLLIRLNWIRQPERQLPSCESDGADVGDLDTQLQEARSVLTTATLEDSNNPQSWFQLANLQYETQDPFFQSGAKESGERKELIENAEKNYKKSIFLLPDDFYIWYRLVQALVARSTLEPGLADQLRREAVSAFCRALALNRNDRAMADTIKNALNEVSGSSATCSVPASPGPSQASATPR